MHPQPARARCWTTSDPDTVQVTCQPWGARCASALPHHKAVTRGIKGARGLLGVVCKAGGQGFGCGKAAQAHAVNGGLGATAHRHIGLATADHAGRITNRLHAGGTGCHRCADWAFQAMANRHMACRQIDQKRWHGERRQALRPACVGGAHGFGNGAKAADARGNDGGRARLRLRVCGRPGRLGQGLLCRAQSEGDESVHLALVLGRGGSVWVPPALGVFGQRGHSARHFGSHAVDHGLGQAAQARHAPQQALPSQLYAAAQGRHQPHASDHHALHFATCIRHFQSSVCHTARSHAFMITTVIISGSTSFAQTHHQKKVP